MRRGRVGIGVIGYGYWGPKIVRTLTQMDDAEAIMVADLSEVRLCGVKEQHLAAPTTTDYRRLLDNVDVDAVIVATPIRTHHRLAKEALAQGKHVLVEKPLAASSAECAELNETAQMVDRVLMVGHTFQHNPAVQKLRELIRSGELGNIFYVDSARLNLGLFQRDIDVMWDLAPHDISILLHIMDARPESVSARGAAHVVNGVDDLAQIDLHYPDATMAHIRVSWLDPFKVRRVTVVGSRKMAVFDDVAEHKLQVYDKRVAFQIADGSTDPNFEYHHGDIETPALEPIEPLRAQLQHFVDCIRTGRKPISDGTLGQEVVHIIEAASASRKLESRRIWLRPDPDRSVETVPYLPGYLPKLGMARSS